MTVSRKLNKVEQAMIKDCLICAFPEFGSFSSKGLYINIIKITKITNLYENSVFITFYLNMEFDIFSISSISLRKCFY